MISVVMPVYNHQEFLDEAISSILKQSYTNFELIIVDDGSTDSCRHIEKKWASKDKRIQCLYKKNGGTGSALNLGFSYAKGKYGTWVSSDNIYYPGMIETLRNFLEDHKECRFVFSGFSVNKKHNYIVSPKTGILSDFLLRSYSKCITGICSLFTTKLKEECGCYSLDPEEDYIMGVRMGLRTQVGYISEVLGVWRQHPGCLTLQLRRNGNKCETGKIVQKLIDEGLR